MDSHSFSGPKDVLNLPPTPKTNALFKSISFSSLSTSSFSDDSYSKRLAELSQSDFEDQLKALPDVGNKPIDLKTHLISGEPIPPPITCLRLFKTGRPYSYFKRNKHDGSYVVDEIKIPNSDILVANKEDGRLRLYTAWNDDNEATEMELEMEDEEEEEE